jgi:hypothetical protein
MTSRATKRVRRWSVAQARANFPDVFAAAAREPQAVYRHNEPIGVVVSPRDFVALDARRTERDGETLGDTFAALRLLGAGPLAIPRRRRALPLDRPR